MIENETSEWLDLRVLTGHHIDIPFDACNFLRLRALLKICFPRSR